MKLLPILAIVVLTGCSSVDRILTVDKMIDKTPFVPAIVQPVQQSAVEWIVINEDNTAESIKHHTILFAITPEHHQNIILNDAEMRRYISQQNTNIEAIQQYYSPSEKTETSNKKPWWRVW